MFILLLFLICIFVALGVGALAALSDVRGMVIPNAYSLCVLVSFLVAYSVVYFSGVDGVFSSFVAHISSGLLTFGFTFALFALKMIGAADSKFASVCALWVGVRDLPAFIFYMAFVGGILGILALYMQRKKPFKDPPSGSWMDQVQNGASKVPYGVAIAFGMLFAFIRIGYFAPDVLSGFLA